MDRDQMKTSDGYGWHDNYGRGFITSIDFGYAFGSINGFGWGCEWDSGCTGSFMPFRCNTIPAYGYNGYGSIHNLGCGEGEVNGSGFSPFVLPA